MLPDVVVDDKALKAALEIMVQPVLLVADGKGVNLSQKLFFAQGMKQTTNGDSSATLTLKEYYDVAILFAQSIPHPKTVAIKLFYTSSDQTSDRGDGPEKKGGKGAKGGKGRPAGLEQEDNSGKVKKINTLDGTQTSVCLYHVWNSSGCNRLNPHCKSASADICHPANRRGTGVLHAEKAKWQGCTFKECSYDPRSIGRGRCIFKHGTGDEQIAKHDKDKAGISSHQAVVNPPLDPGLATGQQPQAGGSP